MVWGERFRIELLKYLMVFLINFPGWFEFGCFLVMYFTLFWMVHDFL